MASHGEISSLPTFPVVLRDPWIEEANCHDPHVVIQVTVSVFKSKTMIILWWWIYSSDFYMDLTDTGGQQGGKSALCGATLNQLH